MTPIEAFPMLELTARDLACSRGGRPVFSGLSFQVASGQVLAVTGPNGSGKSSLLRLLAGLLRPASGTVNCRGACEEEPVAHYLGHLDALKPALTLTETLRFWGAIYRQDRPLTDMDMNETAETVGLRHALNLPVGVLSAGQRRRAALARLMLTPRPLWLMDEPFAALDAKGEELLRKLMAGHVGRNGLIVAATHQPLPVPPDATIELGVA